MTIQDRIIKIRTDAGLSQAEFGEKLNLGKSSVSLFESGKRNLTSRTIADICEKFNVNRAWLDTGEGEPYNEVIPTVMKLLKAEYNLDDLDIQIIEKYMELSPIERQVFKDYIKKIRSV
jgi:transcriptional regulator with XRE-family HTH domain